MFDERLLINLIGPLSVCINLFIFFVINNFEFTNLKTIQNNVLTMS